MLGRNQRKIPVLSFFSGAGFMDIGFLETGRFSIPWHNECHDPFADAYEHGVSKAGFNTGSEKIQSRSRLEYIKTGSIFQQAFDGVRPRVFGVIGGPPCPDFSRAGKNEGGKGKNGKLTRRFAKVIRELRPSFFVIENVPGLLETKKHRKFLFSVLQNLGKFYALDLRVLNALEYGVPQSRRRVFVVGICLKWLERRRRRDFLAISRKSREILQIDVSENRNSKEVAGDIAAQHWFCWPKPQFRDAVARYAPGAGEKCPPELSVKHWFSKTKNHPNASDVFRAHSRKFKRVREGDISRKSFKRLDRRFYSPNAAYGNNEVHLHPTENRRISVAEALALQAVPKAYCFPEGMSLTDKFKAVGNGVPVPLARRIALSLAKFLNGEN
ncbi:MAG: DNA cytosine methyltransferase [Gammaproteobacteria bacterium]|nr:DNA cytosine methyltransferase [Gammaproteobacteria bacterium]